MILEGDNDKNDSLSLCQHSCEDSFQSAEDKKNCQKGCENAISKQEVKVSRPKSLMDLLIGGDDDLLKALEGNDDHRHGGLTISFGLPKMVFDTDSIFDTKNDDDFGLMDGHMGHMFRRMNSQMNHMLSSMKSSMSSMMSKDPFQGMPT